MFIPPIELYYLMSHEALIITSLIVAMIADLTFTIYVLMRVVDDVETL